MKIFILLSLLLSSYLFANEVSQDELNSIYMEAILFVTVFGVMGIISYIYSSRHAKAYKSKKQEVAKNRTKADRIEELRGFLEKELITKIEFELLKEHYLK